MSPINFIIAKCAGQNIESLIWGSFIELAVGWTDTWSSIVYESFKKNLSEKKLQVFIKFWQKIKDNEV